MAKKKIIDEFTTTIGYTGQTRFKGTLGRFHDKNGLKVVRSAIIAIAKKLVGEKDLTLFIRCLAEKLLKDVMEDEAFEKLIPDYNEANNFENNFVLK